MSTQDDVNDIEANRDRHVFDSPSTQKNDEAKDEEKNAEVEPEMPMASLSELFSFGNGTRTRCFQGLGLLCSAMSGLVFPFTAFYFAAVFQTLGAPSASYNFLDDVRGMAFAFLGLGAYAFFFMTVSSTLLESAAAEMAVNLQTEWFQALLRQDMAYHDIADVSGSASMISSSANKYRRGVGRKLGETVQFFIALVGGFVYAFYASWQTSLVILGTVPVMSMSSLAFMKISQLQTSHADKNYADAGNIVYATVSGIRTVLSLNACRTMVSKYEAATDRAYKAACSRLGLVGLANGSMMGSFILGYVTLTLFGAFLLYSAIRETGCDPSGGIDTNITCQLTAVDVFGALMGISFGGMALPQLSTGMEALTKARAAIYPAIHAMNRKVGAGTNSKPVVRKVDEKRRESVVLPEYVIDSSSEEGKRPADIQGSIEFCNVSFAYPSRPKNLVLNNFSLKVEAGQTVALVGPSGGGKSTVTALIERFYDPSSGSISIDGTDLRDINVSHLRDHIGLVQQEPKLFATTIQENIRFGNLEGSDEEVVQSAKMANAHNFIVSFPDQYDTQVGDKGAQLSGGQKQRIAISRVLMKNPKLLLLDEATSALDSESELTVQRALDVLLQKSNRTTIVIAHRLSTIRSCDLIAVVDGGRVVESGSHTDLMMIAGGHYRKLAEASNVAPASAVSANDPQRTKRESVYQGADEGLEVVPTSCGPTKPHIEFKDVRFAYPNRPNSVVFDGLNLKLYKGETLALVGPSGQGKSTTVQLIERFYDPIEGSIEFCGVDLRSINVKWLRDQMGLVQQEPTLFSTTIRENIAYGCPGANQDQIEKAAMMANAHDFVLSFAEGYGTMLGDQGMQLSGGQKQRVAIARAIVKNPNLLILDEATSALDSKSEEAVQSALDNINISSKQTTLVIAHRLSTIRNADRIAVIEGGKVKEIGTFDELMAKPNGRFKRLKQLQDLKGSEFQTMLREERDQEAETCTEETHHIQDKSSDTNDESDPETAEVDAKSAQRAKLMAKSDSGYLALGALGAALAGLVFPAWGIIFAFMIELLFQPVLPCDEKLAPTYGFESCQDYHNSVADDMRQMSFKVSFAWLGVIGATLLGNMLLFLGFGMASERMSRRIRNSAFGSLVRQEVAFFDRQSVGSITTQLQEDAALVHSFSGEPIRAFVMNVASLLVGIVVSFVYMWPFALLALAILPFMGIGSMLEMKMWVDDNTDQEEKKEDDEKSPGGTVMESLLNIQTIASLTLESKRYEDYSKALHARSPTTLRSNLFRGMTYGLSQFLQNWGMALMFWWGGYLLSTYPTLYTFESFLISMMSILFSLSGMAVAAQGITDKGKANAAAKRVFNLIDRQSAIDSVSEEGKKDI